MNIPGRISRRCFTQMGAISALTARTRWLAAAPSIPQQKPGFAFVGAFGERHGIYVYAINGDLWRLRHFMPSDAPVSMALHPNGHWLYVLNGVNEYLGLPCGTVEAFNFEARTGQLTLLGRQPLSLSATLPRSIAVSRAGDSLVVAVHGGGAYNLLPILPEGRVGRVSSMIKVTGCGPIPGHQKSAHPHSIVLDTTGKRCIATDLGADRITTLSLDNGLTIRSQYDLPAGSGPRHLALHPNGELLYVANALENSTSGFRYAPETGTIRERIVHMQGVYGQALAMHPTGNFLYTAGNGEVAAWSIHSSTGTIQHVQSRSIPMPEVAMVQDLVVDPTGCSLFVLEDQGVSCLEIDPDSGRLSSTPFAKPLQVTNVVRSIVFAPSHS